MGKDKPKTSKKDSKDKQAKTEKSKVEVKPVIESIVEEQPIQEKVESSPSDLYHVLIPTSEEKANILEEMVASEPEEKATTNLYTTEAVDYNTYSQYPNIAEDKDLEHFKDLTDTHKFIKKSSAEYQASSHPNDEIE